MNNEKNQPYQNDELLIGRNPVAEALSAGRSIIKVMVAKGNPSGAAVEITAKAKKAGIPVQEVERKKLDFMTGGAAHQGIAALCAMKEYSSVEDILKLAEERGEQPFVIILDEIEDPHNLGAVIRTAECAGAHGVIIPKRRACGLTGTVAKAAAGALATMPVVRVTNLTRTIDELKERGLWIAACDMDGEPYYGADLGGPIGIVVGNEGSGISRLVREHCDFVISIPLRGKINSLNASNAAAVILYEIVRRRINTER